MIKRRHGREEEWPTSCFHGRLHLYPNIPTCTALPLGAKSACSTQSAVAFYHLAVGHSVSECICVCVCLHVCDLKREGAYTSVFMDIDLLTTLPLWFIFKQTAHPFLLFHLSLIPSPALLCSAPNPSIFQNTPILNPSLLPLVLLLHPSLSVSIHPSICIYYPQGRQVPGPHWSGKITSLTQVMCRGFKRKAREAKKEKEKKVWGKFWPKWTRDLLPQVAFQGTWAKHWFCTEALAWLNILLNKISRQLQSNIVVGDVDQSMERRKQVKSSDPCWFM